MNKLAFTGSTATGKRVMAACATTLTPVVIEAGGKDAVIVAEDADLEAAAEAVTFGAMGNAGQTCVGIERAYVVEGGYDEFVKRVAEVASGIRVGAEPDAQLGPITMASQVPIIKSHIEDAIKRGGIAVVGGPESVRPPFDVPEDSDAVREETFGPTLTISKVRDLDEAVSKANATRYGLGSSVYSRSRKTALETANRLRAGMTSINSVQAFALVGALPFGGTGDSGFGRIHGPDGLKEFTAPKAIARQKFKPLTNLLSFARTRKDMDTTLKLVRFLHGRGCRGVLRRRAAGRVRLHRVRAVEVRGTRADGSTARRVQATRRARGVRVPARCGHAQLADENQYKPAETFAISDTVKPMTADAVAAKIVRAIERERFAVFPNGEMALIGGLAPLLAPLMRRYVDRKVRGVQRKRV